MQRLQADLARRLAVSMASVPFHFHERRTGAATRGLTRWAPPCTTGPSRRQAACPPASPATVRVPGRALQSVWFVLRLLGGWACGCVAAQCAEGCSFEVGHFSWQVHAGFDAASQLPPTPADPWKDLITSVLEWQAVKGRAKYGEPARSALLLSPLCCRLRCRLASLQLPFCNAAAAVQTFVCGQLVQAHRSFFMSSSFVQHAEPACLSTAPADPLPLLLDALSVTPAGAAK